MVSNTKGRVCHSKRLAKSAKSFYGFPVDNRKSEMYCKKFAKSAKLFRGFFENDAESENYYKKFEQFRKSYMNPIVVLERLPENVFYGGKVSKRIRVDVKSRRNELMKGSRNPDYTFDAKPMLVSARRTGRLETVDSHLLDSVESWEDDLKRHSFSGVSDLVINITDKDRKSSAQPQDSTKNSRARREGKRERVQTRGSSKRDIHPEKTVKNKNTRGYPMCSDKSAADFETQPLDNESLNEERKKRAFPADGDSFPNKVIVGEKNVPARHVKFEALLKDTCNTRHGQSRPQKCVENLKPTYFTADCNLVQKVSLDVFAQPNTGGQARRPSLTCQIPLQGVVRKEEYKLTRQPANSVAHLEDSVETIRARYCAKCSEKSALEVEAEPSEIGDVQKGEEECKRHLHKGRYVLSRSTPTYSALVHKILHVAEEEEKKYNSSYAATSVIHKVGMPSKCVQGRQKLSDISEVGCQLQNFNSPREWECLESSKPSSHSSLAACSSVQKTHEVSIGEVKRVEDQLCVKCQAPLQEVVERVEHSTVCKIQSGIKDSPSKRARGFAKRSDKAVAEVETQLKNFDENPIQNTPPSAGVTGEKTSAEAQQGHTQTWHSSKYDVIPADREGSELSSSADDIEYDGSYMEVSDSVQNAVDEVTVEKEKRVQVQSLTNSENLRDSKFDCPRKRARRHLKHANTSELGNESQVVIVESSQKCKCSLKSFTTYCNFAEKASDEVTTEEEKCVQAELLECQMLPEVKVGEEGQVQNQHCLQCKNQGENKVGSPTKRALRHTKRADKAEAAVESHISSFDNFQKLKENLIRYPNECNGSIMNSTDSLQKKSLGVVVRDAEKSEAHAEQSSPKCKVPLENEFETDCPQGGLKHSDKATVDMDSHPLNSYHSQKYDDTLKHCSSHGNIECMGCSAAESGSVQRDQDTVFETQHDNKVEIKVSSVRPHKSGNVKSDFTMFDNSLNCDENSGDECNCSLAAYRDSGQKGPDELVVKDEKSFQAPPFLESKIPFISAAHDLLVAEKEERVQAQCSGGKSNIQLDTKQATAFRHRENQLATSTSKSVHKKEPKGNLGTDGFGIKGCSSEACHWNRTWAMLLTNSTSKSMDPKKLKDNTRINEVGNKVCSLEECPWKRMCEMFKPCVVKLKRMPGLDRVVKRIVKQDDSVHYPVVVMAGPRKIVDEHIFRRSFPTSRNVRVISRLPKKQIDPPASNMEVLTRVDLSDGLALKKFCELKSINLVDSDSGDEARDGVIKDRGHSEAVIPISESDDENHVDVIEDCASSPVLSPVPEDRASSTAINWVLEDRLSHMMEDRSLSPVVSHVLEDRASSPILAPAHENRISSCIQPDVDLLHSLQMVEGLDPSADSVVSENPVPSGVQALNELGFLDNESFQFGKEHPSENIWSDVLDFGETDESGMKGVSSQDRDLLPLLSEDLIPCLDSEKPVEVGTVSGKVTISTGLDKKSGLQTININSKRQENGTDILLSDKEYLVNDPLLSKEHIEEQNAEISKSAPSNNLGESEFLTSLIRPEKMPLDGFLQRGSKKIAKGNKHVFHNWRDTGTIQDGAKEKIKKRTKCGFHNASNGMAGIGSAEDNSLPVVGSKKVQSVSKKPKSHDHGSKNVPDSVLTDRDVRELKHRRSTSWMTQNMKVDKGKNNGSVDNEGKSKGIQTDGKEEIPTSEKLYRDLSAIPYIVKCNLQNRCRKCKNLNPCANANKNFKLFWTLTVGDGRRLSKPLIDTFQNPEDPCLINRTAAYIAASAVDSRNSTILVPAFPEAVQKVLPIHHSKLLMQLVAETVEMEEQEKRSNSDMAIAETLQFKRALIAMKARLPNVENKDPPQSKQSMQNSLVHPGRPFSYKSNQIIAVKSKVDNKFRFVRKCLVSILPKDSNKVVSKSEDAFGDKKSGYPAPKESLHGDKHLELRTGSPSEKRSKLTQESDPSANGSCALASTIPANTMGIATTEPSNDVIGAHETTDVSCDVLLTNSSNHRTNARSPPKRASSTSSDENHTESTEPALKKLVLDSSCGKRFRSNSDVSSETVRQINSALSLNDAANHTSGTKPGGTSMLPFERGTAHVQGVSFQKPRETRKANPQNVSLNKPDSRRPVDLPTGNADDFHANRPRSSSLTSGICSVSSDESGYGSAENKTNLHPPKRKTVTIFSNHLPRAAEYVQFKTSELTSRKEGKMVPTHAVCTQVTPDIVPSENQFPKVHPSSSTQKNEVHPEYSDSVQTLADPQDPNDLPDVILIPDEVESIDLTSGEDETVDLTNEPFPKWGIICSALPELGFVRVEKIAGNLILSDRSVVSNPVEFNSFRGLNTFLNARLAEPSYSHQSEMDLQWILVTSGYLAIKNMPPTNPKFWLTPPGKTRENMKDSAKQLQPPQKNSITRLTTSSVQPTKGGKSNPTPPFKFIVGSVGGKESKRFKSIDSTGKIVRINGQRVVIGTPAKCTKKQVESPDKSMPTSAPQVLAERASSLNCSTTCGPKPSSTASYAASETSVPSTRSVASGGLNSAPTQSCLAALPVPLASSPVSSVIQITLPATNPCQSPSTVPNLVVNTVPAATPQMKYAVSVTGTTAQYIILPGSISPSGQPIKYVLNASQPVIANPSVSSALGGLSTLPSIPASSTCMASTISVPLVPAASTGLNPILPAPMTQQPDATGAPRTQTFPAPRIQQNNKIHVPLSATRGVNPILPAPRLQQHNTIRVPMVPAASLTPPTPPRTGESTPILAHRKQMVATLANSMQFVSKETSKSVKSTVHSSPTPSGHASSPVPLGSTSLLTALPQKQKQVPVAAKLNPPRSHRPILILRKGSSSQAATPTSNPRKFIFQTR